MRIDNDFAYIINMFDPSEYPKAVTDALAIEAEAEAVLARVGSGEPVDLTALQTPKDVAKVHAAAVTQTIGRDVSLEVARKILDITHGMVGDAWFNATPAIGQVLAARFDAAAATLVAEMTAFGNTRHLALAAAREHWNPSTAALREALVTLNALRQARGTLALLDGIEVDKTYSIPFENDSRTLWFPSTMAHTTFRRAKNGESSDDYYIFAATTPGVLIKWQTKRQQQEQPSPAMVTKSKAETAAQYAAQAALVAAQKAARHPARR